MGKNRNTVSGEVHQALIKKLAKKLAYRLGAQAKEGAGLSPKDFIEAFRNPQRNYDELRAYLYGPESSGMEPFRGKTTGPSHESLSGTRDAKEYKAVLNPEGEYVFPERVRPVVEAAANVGSNIYLNADLLPFTGGYRYDAANHPVRVTKDNNGNIVGSAADVFDFDIGYLNRYDAPWWQVLPMSSAGEPYIVRQDNIPVRFVGDDAEPVDQMKAAKTMEAWGSAETPHKKKNRTDLPGNMGTYDDRDSETIAIENTLLRSGMPILEPSVVTADYPQGTRYHDGGLLRRFDEGGDKDGDNVQLYYSPSPDDVGVNFTVAPTVEPLHVETPYTPDDFFERWYPNRMQQVQNNLMVMNRNNGRLFPNKQAGKDARPFVNSMLRNAKLVKEYTLLHPGHDDKEKYFTFPSALKDSVARTVLNNGVRAKNQILGKEIKADYSDSDLRWEAFGTYGFSKPSYPHLIFYTTANPSENTIVHERTHPLRPELGSKLGKDYMVHPLFTGDAWNPMEYKIATMVNQLMTTEKGANLKPESAEYYFSPEEINARMNAIREQQNLNPKHTITKDDLQEIKKNASSKDREGLLDLIDDDSLLRLFNEVADTREKADMSNIAASGGKIHINPKNRGKFNALKKRTGKTTEELTHSKNPLTRRRAIFAQNAAKWKHGDGGLLDRYSPEQIRIALNKMKQSK